MRLLKIGSLFLFSSQRLNGLSLAIVFKLAKEKEVAFDRFEGLAKSFKEVYERSNIQPIMAIIPKQSIGVIKEVSWFWKKKEQISFR